MSRPRWLAYVALMTPATLIGLPMSGLIELYVLQFRPASGSDWVITVVMHAEFVALVVLVVLAWWKLLRAARGVWA